MTTGYYLVTLINAYNYLKKSSKLILISYAAELTERARELSAVCLAHFTFQLETYKFTHYYFSYLSNNWKQLETHSLLSVLRQEKGREREEGVKAFLNSPLLL